MAGKKNIRGGLAGGGNTTHKKLNKPNFKELLKNKKVVSLLIASTLLVATTFTFVGLYANQANKNKELANENKSIQQRLEEIEKEPELYGGIFKFNEISKEDNADYCFYDSLVSLENNAENLNKVKDTLLKKINNNRKALGWESELTTDKINLEIPAQYATEEHNGNKVIYTFLKDGVITTNEIILPSTQTLAQGKTMLCTIDETASPYNQDNELKIMTDKGNKIILAIVDGELCKFIFHEKKIEVEIIGSLRSEDAGIKELKGSCARLIKKAQASIKADSENKGNRLEALIEKATNCTNMKKIDENYQLNAHYFDEKNLNYASGTIFIEDGKIKFKDALRDNKVYVSENQYLGKNFIAFDDFVIINTDSGQKVFKFSYDADSDEGLTLTESTELTAEIIIPDKEAGM